MKSSLFERHAPKHAVTGSVALGLIAVACLDGGYPQETTAGIGLAIWWALALGLVFGVLPVARLPRTASVVLGAVAALTAFTALSLWWAHDDGAAFADIVRAVTYLGLFAACLLVARPRGIRSWTDGLCFGLGAIIALAFIARTIPGLETDEAIALFLPEAAGRLSFPLGYWNALAGIIAMALPLLLQRSVDAPTRFLRGAAAAILPTAIVCIYLTASRAGLIAGVAALAVLVIFGDRRRETAVVLLAALLAGGALIAAARGFASFRLAEPTAAGDRQGALMLVAAVLAGAAIAWVALQRERWAPRIRARNVPRGALVTAAIVIVALAVVVVNPARRLDELRQPQAFTSQEKAPRSELLSGTGNGRKEFWQAATDAYAAEPLRGIGVGGYAEWFARTGSIYYPVRDAHSMPLEVLAELGTVGFALLLLAGGGVAVGGALRWREGHERGDTAALGGLLAAAAIAVSLDWSWEIPSFAFPVLIAAAAVIGPAGAAAALPRRDYPWRGVLAVAGVAIASVAIWACWTSFLHSWRLEGSRSAAGAGDLITAEDRARDAIEAEPWAADARGQLALVLERQGDLVGALAAIRSANRTNPWDGRLWFLRARIALTAGNVAEAQRALESARALRPRDPVFSVG